MGAKLNSDMDNHTHLSRSMDAYRHVQTMFASDFTQGHTKNTMLNTPSHMNTCCFNLILYPSIGYIPLCWIGIARLLQSIPSVCLIRKLHSLSRPATRADSHLYRWSEWNLNGICCGPLVCRPTAFAEPVCTCGLWGNMSLQGVGGSDSAHVWQACLKS